MKISQLPPEIRSRITSIGGKTPMAGELGSKKKTSAPRGMNKWESKYAQYLHNLQQAGEIIWFDFECWRLRLGRDAYYKPDFVVLWKDGRVTFEEVKGFWREAAKVRIKVVAEKYPFDFYVVRPDGQGWNRTKV